MTNPVRRAIERACAEPAYRARLVADPRAALAAEGIDVPAHVEVEVHEVTDRKIVVVLPARDGQWEERVRSLPSGPVADVPRGLSLVWKDATLSAEGQVDSLTAPALQRELVKAFVDIDLDLFGVRFMSSAGLSALVAGQKHLQGHDCTLRLRRVRDEILNLLDMVGFIDAFEIDNRDKMDPFPYFGPWQQKR